MPSDNFARDMLIGGGLVAGGAALATSSKWAPGAAKAIGRSAIKGGWAATKGIGRFAFNTAIPPERRYLTGVAMRSGPLSFARYAGQRISVNKEKLSNLWGQTERSGRISSQHWRGVSARNGSYRWGIKGGAANMRDAASSIMKIPGMGIIAGAGLIAGTGYMMFGGNESPGTPKQPTNIQASTAYTPNLADNPAMSHTPHQMMTQPEARAIRYSMLAQSTQGLVQGLNNSRRS